MKATTPSSSLTNVCGRDRSAGEPGSVGVSTPRAGSPCHHFLGALHRDTRATISMEYMLILALIVLPIVALMPMFLGMIRLYGGRVVSLMGLPVP